MERLSGGGGGGGGDLLLTGDQVFVQRRLLAKL